MKSFDFLKEPIPYTEDGVSCIVVHGQAQTELGRLLAGCAKLPFDIPGFPNPDNATGEFESFYAAVATVGSDKMKLWASDYICLHQNTQLTSRERNQLEMWYKGMMHQNWYLLDLLQTSTLPLVWVYEETVLDAEGRKTYIPMSNHDFIQHLVRAIRTAEKNTRREKALKEVKRAKKAGTYSAVKAGG